MGTDRSERRRCDTDDPGNAPAGPRGDRQSAIRRQSGQRRTRSGTGSRLPAPWRQCSPATTWTPSTSARSTTCTGAHGGGSRRRASTSCARSRWRSRSTTDGPCSRRASVPASSWRSNHHLPARGIHRTIRDAWSPAVRSGGCSPSGCSTRSCCRRGSRAGDWGAAPAVAWRWTSPVTTLPSSIRWLAIFRLTLSRWRPGRAWGAAAEDALMSTLRYADGVLVQTHDAFTDRATRQRACTCSVRMERSMATNADGRRIRSGRSCCATPSGEREIEPEDRRDLYEINVAVASRPPCVARRPPGVTGLEGLRAVQVALAVRQAAEIGERECRSRIEPTMSASVADAWPRRSLPIARRTDADPGCVHSDEAPQVGHRAGEI